MPADYTWVQGDVLPVASDTLTYSDNTAVNLAGATVSFIMRSLTAEKQQTLTGETKVVSAAKGEVSFTPSAIDTGVPGNYMANWLVTFSGGKPMTFPTTGYLWVQIQENLTTAGGAQLVGLPEIKDYLNIPANDRTHDTKLLSFIGAARPLIENMVGPVLPTTFNEWHDGGNYFISLRRRPSTALGTSPVFTLMACSEYRGPAEYSLSIVADPAHGSIYSCFFEKRQGIVERRTSGGGVISFPPMAGSVHVVYQAGQEVVPENVREAALEIVRTNYQTTQAVGGGRQTVADADEYGQPYGGLFVPKKARELLQPNRRAPAIY